MAIDNFPDNTKYYFYYYGLFGRVGTAKRCSDTPANAITIQEHEISKDDYDTLTLGQLIRMYPLKPVS